MKMLFCRDLIRLFQEAKVSRSPEVVICGSGSSIHEFMFIDDMVAARVYFLMVPPHKAHG